MTYELATNLKIKGSIYKKFKLKTDLQWNIYKKATFGIKGSCLKQVYFYKKLRFGTLISWPTYAGSPIKEVSTMAVFTVYLHIFWKHQPMHSPQANNRVKLPNDCIGNWCFFSKKIRWQKIWEKNIVNDQSYLIFDFLVLSNHH